MNNIENTRKNINNLINELENSSNIKNEILSNFMDLLGKMEKYENEQFLYYLTHLKKEKILIKIMIKTAKIIIKNAIVQKHY